MAEGVAIKLLSCITTRENFNWLKFWRLPIPAAGRLRSYEQTGSNLRKGPICAITSGLPTIGELTSSVNTVSLSQFRDNPWGS